MRTVNLHTASGMKTVPVTTLSADESAPIWHELFACLRSHGDALAEIAARGRIAVVFHNVAKDFSGSPTSCSADWKGDTENGVGTLTRFIKTDSVTDRWVSTPVKSGHAKVLLFVHYGSFLLNLTPGEGWSIEPSSLDSHQHTSTDRAAIARAAEKRERKRARDRERRAEKSALLAALRPWDGKVST